VALFVRDALALAVPALPGLDPPVPVLSPDGADRAAVAAEWPGWRADILEFCRYRLTAPPGTHPEPHAVATLCTDGYCPVPRRAG
jgi:hypothetical protein